MGSAFLFIVMSAAHAFALSRHFAPALSQAGD
jgi:hypothetical protein